MYDPGVEDHADARLAMPQGNEPGPRAETHVMVRRKAARAHVAARERQRAAGRQPVDMTDVRPSAPDRGGRVLMVALDQAEALAEERRPPGGVDDPAAGHGLGLVAILIGPLERDPMVEVAELDVADAGRTDE